MTVVTSLLREILLNRHIAGAADPSLIFIGLNESASPFGETSSYLKGETFSNFPSILL